MLVNSQKLRVVLPFLVAVATAGVLVVAAQVARSILLHRATAHAAEEKMASLETDVGMIARRLANRLGDLVFLKELLEREIAETGSVAADGPAVAAARGFLKYYAFYDAITVFGADGRAVYVLRDPALRSSGEEAPEVLRTLEGQAFSETLSEGGDVAVASPLFLRSAAAGDAAPGLLLSCQLQDAQGGTFGVLMVDYRVQSLLQELLVSGALGASKILMDAAGKWAVEADHEGRWTFFDRAEEGMLSRFMSEELRAKTADWFSADGGVFSARRVRIEADATGLFALPIRVAPVGRLDWIVVVRLSRESIERYFLASEAGVWLVTMVAMILLVPASYFGMRSYLAATESGTQLNNVLDSALHGFLAMDREKHGSGGLTVRFCNKAAARLLGIPLVPAAGAQVREKAALPPDLALWIEGVCISGEPSSGEYRMEDASGTRWLLVRAAPMSSGAVVSLADITRRKNSEEALAANEKSLRLAARMGKLGAWAVEYPERRVVWSSEVRRIHAVPEDYQPTLEDAMNFYVPPGTERLKAVYQACEQQGRPFDDEFEFRDAQGVHKWVRAIGEAEFDEQGNLKRLVGAFQDLTESHNATVALNETRERLEAAFWGGGMSPVERDLSAGGVVFDDNLAWMLGYDPSVVREDPGFWDRSIHPDDLAQIEAAREAYLSGEAECLEAEYRLVAENGEERWVLERSRTVESDESGRPLRAAGVLIDISKLKDTERRLEESLLHEKELAREAQAAANVKKDFLAVMSHEIRTPLNSIIGFSEILGDSDLPPEAIDHIRTIRQSGETLLRIINDILDYSRIESGRMPIENLPFSPSEIVKSTISLLKPAAASKGIDLRAEVGNDLEPELLGDGGRIRQVLVNLLGNAIKFTRQGSVSVRVTASPARHREQKVFFSVSDTGPGIPSAKLRTVFEPFTQVDASISRLHGGTGLGLSIARLLVELMGGELQVESVVGSGSTFSFALPLALPSASAPAAHKVGTESGFEKGFAARHPLRILVAEDDKINARLTRLVLEKFGYVAEIVGDGRAAVDSALSTSPDVIIMDIHMPHMDGIEATREIRSRETDRHCFIAAFTADVQTAEIQSCYDAGMDEFLSKPLSVGALKAFLERASESIQQNGNGGHNGGRAGARASDELAPAPVQEPTPGDG